jgi:glycosyltransferase involved in cell wall biosynthesis
MTVSIVIPAHDEEAVIGRCLAALADGAAEGELDVVVVCNGCKDGTAAAARAAAPAARVIEIEAASKPRALNAGDAAARAFPRLYVDADVVLSLAAVRRVAAVLTAEGALAAAPVMDLDTAGAAWPVRAFYDVWTRLPYTREGMIGVGVFGLSAAGRGRFGEFPDVIADDGYVRMHFRADERVRVDDAPVRVKAPATFAGLVAIMTRSRLGGYELERRFPDLVAREQSGKRYGSAAGVVAVRPWLWPQAFVYLAVNLIARRRAARQLARREAYVWERDESSRR